MAFVLIAIGRFLIQANINKTTFDAVLIVPPVKLLVLCFNQAKINVSLKATHMVSKVALLQPTQLEIIATSSQYLGRMVMQDKGAHLKAQMWQFKV